MTFNEEIEQILDKYIVMKHLTDNKAFPVVVRNFQNENYVLHRKKSGSVYEIKVYSETSTVEVKRNDGGYLEKHFFYGDEVKQIDMTHNIERIPGREVDFKGQKFTHSDRKLSVWTIFGAEHFERFLMIVDKSI